MKRQAIERRALPKRIRVEMKAREMMFRESMRISVNTASLPSGLASLAGALNFPETPDNERDKLRKFQEQEKKRYKAEEQRCELKHRRQLEEHRAAADSAVKGKSLFILLNLLVRNPCEYYRAGTTSKRETQNADGTRNDETQITR